MGGLFTLTAHAEQKTVTEPLRLGIISIASPSTIYTQWQPFADYLSKQTGLPVQLIIPKGFAKIQQAVEHKDVDIFFVNSHIFYRLKQQGKATPLAQVVNLDGSITSRSVLFVRDDSGITSLKQLKGEKIAFVSPMGAGGYLAPRAELYKQGIKTPSDTEEDFTKNLSSSIHKVLIGDAKAGTMCGLNFKLMSSRINTGDLRIIGESDDYLESIIGARSDLDPTLHHQIREILLSMDKDAAGNKLLSHMQDMKILRFTPYDEKNEAITRKLLKDGGFDQ